MNTDSLRINADIRVNPFALIRVYLCVLNKKAPNARVAV
jgi:hypothetical protein